MENEPEQEPPLRCIVCKARKPADEFEPTNSKRHRGVARRSVCEDCKPWKARRAQQDAEMYAAREAKRERETAREEALARLSAKQVKAMCTSKTKHLTLDDVLAAASRSSRRVAVIRFYECPLCSGLHLTRRTEAPPGWGTSIQTR